MITSRGQMEIWLLITSSTGVDVTWMGWIKVEDPQWSSLHRRTSVSINSSQGSMHLSPRNVMGAFALGHLAGLPAGALNE